MPPEPAPRILVVDDEEAARKLVHRVLRDAEYDVALASDGPEALRIVEQHVRFDAFVIDLVMPEMSGDALAQQIRSGDPDAKVLYISGFSHVLLRQIHPPWQQDAFLDKPVTPQRLLEAVSRLLGGRVNRTRRAE